MGVPQSRGAIPNPPFGPGRAGFRPTSPPPPPPPGRVKNPRPGRMADPTARMGVVRSPGPAVRDPRGGRSGPGRRVAGFGSRLEPAAPGPPVNPPGDLASRARAAGQPAGGSCLPGPGRIPPRSGSRRLRGSPPGCTCLPWSWNAVPSARQGRFRGRRGFSSGRCWARRVGTRPFFHAGGYSAGRRSDRRSPAGGAGPSTPQRPPSPTWVHAETCDSANIWLW